VLPDLVIGYLLGLATLAVPLGVLAVYYRRQRRRLERIKRGGEKVGRQLVAPNGYGGVK